MKLFIYCFTNYYYYRILRTISNRYTIYDHIIWTISKCYTIYDHIIWIISNCYTVYIVVTIGAFFYYKMRHFFCNATSNLSLQRRENSFSSHDSNSIVFCSAYISSLLVLISLYSKYIFFKNYHFFYLRRFYKYEYLGNLQLIEFKTVKRYKYQKA